jgi:hypothetical protein
MRAPASGVFYASMRPALQVVLREGRRVPWRMHFKAPQPSQSAGVMRLERKACHDEPLDVLGAWLQLETRSRLHQRVDWIETTCGKHTLLLGSSVYARANAPREGEQARLPERT